MIALLTDAEIEAVKAGGRVKNGISRDALALILRARDSSIGPSMARRVFEFLTGSGSYADDSASVSVDIPDAQKLTDRKEWEHDSENGTAKLSIETSEEIKTLEDLIRVAEIDTSVWAIEKWNATSWTTTVKIKKPLTIKVAGGEDRVEMVMEPQVVRNYGVKAQLRVRAYENALSELVKDLRKDLSEAVVYVPKAPAIIGIAESPYMALIAMPDAHFGKLAITMEDWSLDKAKECYTDATGMLLDRAIDFDLNTILTLSGHDGAHIDNAKGLTTKGTNIDFYGPYRKIVRALLSAHKIQISLALERSKHVKNLVVPGNHDENTAFTIGLALQEAFSGVSRVTIDNGDNLRKYARWGRVLLGFTHGKHEKKNELPMIMMKEADHDLLYGTDVHEWHTGHLHHRSAQQLGTYSEDMGVMVRVSPSLSPADDFHVRNGYIGALRGAELFVYHKDQGLVAQYFFSPDLAEAPLPHRNLDMVGASRLGM